LGPCGQRQHTNAIRAGDAVPIQLNDAHSVENTGSEPLELLIVGVSRDNPPGG